MGTSWTDFKLEDLASGSLDNGHIGCLVVYMDQQEVNLNDLQRVWAIADEMALYVFSRKGEKEKRKKREKEEKRKKVKEEKKKRGKKKKRKRGKEKRREKRKRVKE